MASPPPLPEYRVSHLGAIRGPFPIQFLEAMVLAGQFPRDVKVMPCTGGEWTVLTNLIGKSAPAAVHKCRVPNCKTLLSRILSVAMIVGVVAFACALILSEAAKRENAKLKANWTAAATPVPTPRYSPPAQRSSLPKTSSSSSMPVSGSYPDATPISLPPTRKAVAVDSSPPTSAPPVASAIYTDDSGQTYSVSNYDFKRLQQMKLKLTSDQSLIVRQQASLTALEKEIDRDRQLVNRYSQASIDSFNAKISNYNNQVKVADDAVDQFNRKVDEFNAELQRVGKPTR